MEASRTDTLYGGDPIILVSARLPQAAKLTLHGLGVVSFQIVAGNISLGGGLQALPGDVAAAFVADFPERRALVAYMASLGRASPLVVDRPTVESGAEAVVTALTQKLGEAGRREARLLEALVGLRAEAEETRAAMARLIEQAGVSLASQSLAAALDEVPGPPEDDLVYEGAFEVSVATPAEIYGLAALSLTIAPLRVAAEDRLEIVLKADEANVVLGAWRVPLAGLPARRDWLTLDLPLSLSAARQTAVVSIRGRLSPQSAVAFGRCEDRPALRLYAARAPRLADSPYWSWPDAASTRGVEATALPAGAWTEARLIGGGARVGGAARGEIRLRLPGGAGAMLIFPAVALVRTAGVAARLRAPGQDEIVAAVGLLPPTGDLGEDVATLQEAGLAWSALQSVRNEAAGVMLPVPPEAAAGARIVLALRNTRADAAEPALINCDGVWLLQPRRVLPPADFSSLGLATRVRDTAFDEARLDEAYVSEGYSHLDLRITGLSEGPRRWPSVKFKLAREGNIPGLEFRLGGDRAACFENWPGERSDDYGPLFKINGQLEFIAAIARCPAEKDRRLLVALADVMPDIVRALAARGDVEGESAQAWLALAKALRGWTL